MGRFLILLTVLAVVFVGLEREKLYLRDPLAHVARDGVAVDGAKVLINFSNDALLEDTSGGRLRVYLAQHWDDGLIVPAELKCLGVMVCLTDADHAGGAVVAPGTRGKREPFVGVTLTDRRAEFVDEDGALVVVTLR